MLTPLQAQVLTELCEAFEIPRARWQYVPLLQATFETLAAINLERDLVAGGYPADSARRESASKLGVSAETIKARRRRMFYAGWMQRDAQVCNAPSAPLAADSDSECEAEEDAA